MAYTDFLKLVMENPDLQLRSRQAALQLTDEQREPRQVVFEMLVSRSSVRICGRTTIT